MPYIIAAVFPLTIIVVVFLGYARADEQARRDRDRSRSQTSPPSTP